MYACLTHENLPISRVRVSVLVAWKAPLPAKQTTYVRNLLVIRFNHIS